MRFFSLLLLTLLVACGPKPKPVPAVDSTATPDSLVWPNDYQGQQPTEYRPAPGLLQPFLTSFAPAPTGLLFGMSGFKPTSRWCPVPSFLNSTNMTVEPRYVAAMLRVAEQCGFAFAPAIPRAPTRTNGRWNGPFSPAKYKAVVDAYAAALPLATWQSYARRGIIPYLYTMDDMGCAACNGGEVISQQVTAEMMKYTQEKFCRPTGIPCALRVHPEWMAREGMTRQSWAMPDGKSSVDLTISQYYTIFTERKNGPTQVGWYDNQKRIQAQLGIPKQSYTVAYGGCYRASISDGCPPETLRRLGLVANAYPGNCANIGWNWREPFAFAPYLAVLKELAADAASRPTVDCRPGPVTASLDSVKGSPEITRSGGMIVRNAAWGAPDTTIWLKTRTFTTNFKTADRMVFTFIRDTTVLARHILPGFRDSLLTAGPAYDSTATFQGCAQIWLSGDSTRATPVPAKCWAWVYKRPGVARLDSVKRATFTIRQ